MVAIAKLNSKGAAAMSEYLNEQIGYDVQGTAEWRRRKAEQFPDDARNLQAAEELERIADEIAALDEGLPIHKQIEEACEFFNKAIEASGRDCWDEIVSAISEELRSVGFHSSHSGISLLEWYRDLLRDEAQECLDRAVPVPDLAEEVENDPAVKTAKQSYEEAKAKAYAEARKRL
jgi:hypothetical protein